MFDSLTDRFDGILGRIRGKGRIGETDVDEIAREIRLALLEADVNITVVRSLIDRVKERAIGADVSKALNPGQQIIKIVHEELVATLGGASTKLSLNPKPPTVILLEGLQGSGKTTHAAKLALHFKNEGQSVMLAGADLQRPAAVEQLRVLAERIGVPMYSAPTDPVQVAKDAKAEATRLGTKVLIVDTAGRLQIDADLMAELTAIRAAVDPDHTLLVVDAMTGQEAVNVAVAFDEASPIDGVILSKTDGDARGGAALSVKEVVGKPILFVGTGEKLEQFEPFHPDRLASRILGMGDVLSLIEKAEAQFDESQAEEAEALLRKGDFSLDDFLKQMRRIKKMGSLKSIVGMMPGMPKELRSANLDDGQLTQIEAIICSMTLEERENPDLINGSRRLRIAKGSGTTTAQVNAFLKQFKQMRQMMRSMMQSGKKGRFGMPAMPPELAARFEEEPSSR